MFCVHRGASSDFKKNLRMRIHDEKTELKVGSMLQTVTLAILCSTLFFPILNDADSLAWFSAFDFDLVV